MTMVSQAKTTDRICRLTIVILLGLVFAASHGQEATPEKQYLPDAGLKTQNGVQKRMKGKRIKKTNDLPRHRVKRTPHGWKGDHKTIKKEALQGEEPKVDTKPERRMPHGWSHFTINNEALDAEAQESEPLDEDAFTEEWEEPTMPTKLDGWSHFTINKAALDTEETAKNTERRLKKGIQDKARDFRRQGAGRGAGRRATGGGADNTSNNGGLRPRGVPMVDWTSWATVWMDDGLNERQNLASATVTSDAREPDRPAAAEGGGGRGGDRGRGGRNRGNTGGGGGGGEGRGGANNPYLGEMDWRDQFVSRLTPKPSRPPTTPPPSTPYPTPHPTHPSQSHPQTQSQPEPDKPDNPQSTPQSTPQTSSSSGSSSGSCQLCPSGTAAHMTRTLIGTSVTCQNVAGTLATVDAASCASQKSELPVDIEAYCGCPGVANRGSCGFCGAGLDNIWHNISIPALNDWTCQDVEDYCDFITNSAACSEMAAIASLCCGTWEEYWAYGDDDWTDDTTAADTP